MMTLGVIHSINGALRGALVGHLLKPLYWIINMLYGIIINIANTEVLSSETVYGIFNKIQLILAVFMIFRIMVSLIQTIVSPESGKNQEGNFMGVSKFTIIIKRILLGLILIVLLRPVNVPLANAGSDGENRLNKFVHNNGIIFGILYDLQYRILNNHNIECLISGACDGTNPESDDKDVASQFSDYIVASFVTPNYKEDADEAETDESISREADTSKWVCGDDSDEDTQELIQRYQNHEISAKEFLSEKVYSDDCDKKHFTFNYNYILLILLLIVVAYILIGFLIDIGIRSIKLTILRLISPIPVISYMSNEKDQILNNWVKNLVSTYVDLFVRLAILFLGFDVISEIINGGSYLSTGDNSMVNILTKIIISIALLIFLRMAPKYITGLLGIKGTGSNIGLSAMTAGLGALRVGGTGGEALDAMRNNVSANQMAYNQGKAMASIGESLTQGEDMMAKRLTGNPNATWKSLKEGERRARRMDLDHNTEDAKAKRDNAIEAQQTADAMAEQFKNHGWKGLTSDQQNKAIDSLRNSMSEDEKETLLGKNWKAMSKEQQNAALKSLAGSSINSKLANDLSQRAVSSHKNEADAAVASAEKNYKKWTELNDNLRVNRTKEATSYKAIRSFSDLKERAADSITGHRFGGSGLPGTIRTGGKKIDEGRVGESSLRNQ